MKSFLFTISFLLFGSFFVSAQQTTTVYIVRHAEKDPSNPSNTDPSLNGEGLQRSYDLKEVLQKENIEAIFSTNYKRTQLTGTPLAQYIKKDIIPYDPTKNDVLVKTIIEQYKGKKVLIVGHSNTILTIVKAFGATPSMQQIPDTQYNLLFELNITPEKTNLKERTYGQ